jgi:hypothetical protein
MGQRFKRKTRITPTLSNLPNSRQTRNLTPTPRRPGHLCSGRIDCRGCADESRWERIFQKKFADPNYYTDPITRNGSSLSDSD